MVVLGCHPGDCHYTEGNYHARRRYALMHRLLEYMGIERERLLVDWVSAAEGRRYAALVTAFAAQVKDLGPWGGRNDVMLNEVRHLPPGLRGDPFVTLRAGSLLRSG